MNRLQTRHPGVEDLLRAQEPVLLPERIRLIDDCLQALGEVASDWVRCAATAQQRPADPIVEAEQYLTGPVIVARQLQLARQTLSAVLKTGQPNLPGRVQVDRDGRVYVPIFPTSGFYDRLTFFGLSAVVRMKPGTDPSQLFGPKIDVATSGRYERLSVVLGAGNVSSIPALDSLNRILFEGSRVVLKLNPVNDYLQSFFATAFKPLVDRGLLRVVAGDALTGKQLIKDPAVTDVHITGSKDSHDAIVWGPPGGARRQRQADNRPLLTKSITSELGNVSPWIIVPGRYSNRQLQSQAKHIAASITNNASFNCLATKVIVTSRTWPQRRPFLESVQHFLRQTPLRPAYYPGAVERYRQFSGGAAKIDDSGCLPWTLLTDQKVDDRPELFQQESFVCVCAETTLDASLPVQFLQQATEFVNDQLFGTLCCSVTIPSDFRRKQATSMQKAVADLRYGAVCLNQWSGLAYGLVSPPWGAYPGSTLQNVQSGIGSVHNTYLLDGAEKTVLSGPLINLPSPIWFPSHRSGSEVAKKLLALYLHPSIGRLPGLFLKALQS